jgi:hypothetical protein
MIAIMEKAGLKFETYGRLSMLWYTNFTPLSGQRTCTRAMERSHDVIWLLISKQS